MAFFRLLAAALGVHGLTALDGGEGEDEDGDEVERETAERFFAGVKRWWASVPTGGAGEMCDSTLSPFAVLLLTPVPMAPWPTTERMRPEVVRWPCSLLACGRMLGLELQLSFHLVDFKSPVGFESFEAAELVLWTYAAVLLNLVMPSAVDLSVGTVAVGTESPGGGGGGGVVTVVRLCSCAGAVVIGSREGLSPTDSSVSPERLALWGSIDFSSQDAEPLSGSAVSEPTAGPCGVEFAKDSVSRRPTASVEAV